MFRFSANLPGVDLLLLHFEYAYDIYFSTQTIDALDSTENLTELGQHLVDLPIEPRLGKTIKHKILFFSP